MDRSIRRRTERRYRATERCGVNGGRLMGFKSRSAAVVPLRCGVEAIGHGQLLVHLEVPNAVYERYYGGGDGEQVVCDALFEWLERELGSDAVTSHVVALRVHPEDPGQFWRDPRPAGPVTQHAPTEAAARYPLERLVALFRRGLAP